MKEREAFFIVMIGRPGCGKTSMAMKFVDQLGKNKTLIVDPDGLEEKWNKYALVDGTNPAHIKELIGIKRCLSPGKKKANLLFHNIYQNFRNGLLILDDCRVYLKSKVDDSLEDMCRRKRQMMSDIICITHSWGETPPFFFRFATHYVIFATDEPIEKRKNEINNFEKVKAIKEKVDQIASSENKYYSLLVNVSKLNSHDI